METPTQIQQHRHVFEKRPNDSFIKEHPQQLYIWLKPTAVTNISVTSKVSDTKVKEYTISDIEVEEAYYDNYYSGVAYPVNVKQKLQRISFPYYFSDGIDFAILTIKYDYTWTCPPTIEEFLRSKINQNVSDANIYSMLEKKGYCSVDVQNWIDAINDGDATIVSDDRTKFFWPIQSMVTPKWNNL